MVIPASDTTEVTVSQSPLPSPLSPAALLLSDGLSQRWGKFEARLMRCRSNFNEENIHDLRVSMRRLMALLTMCKAVSPSVKVKGLRRQLKLFLDSLDEVRDTQVMLLFLRKNFRKYEAAVPLTMYLLMQETHFLRQLGFEITEIDVESLSEKIMMLRSSLEASLTGTGVAEQILAVVDEAYAEVQWRKVNVNLEIPASFHAMRIAFKKFRYMLEVAEPLIPPMPPTRPRILHHYQGMMGDIQDMVVLIGFLDRFTAENPQFDIAAVRNFTVQKRDERMEYFVVRINQLNRYWRKSPAVRFPWRPPVITPSLEEVELEDE